MKILKRYHLRVWIYGTIAALALVSAVGGAALIWHGLKLQALFDRVLETDLLAVEEADRLELDLLNQNGNVSSYFITGDEKWLIELGRRRQEFVARLARVKALAQTDDERQALAQVEAEYAAYLVKKDEAIELDKTGRRDLAMELYESARLQCVKIAGAVGDFRNSVKPRIAARREQSRAQSLRQLAIVAAMISLTGALALVLAIGLTRQVLDPIRRLALDANLEGGRPSGHDVTDLSARVRSLIANVGQTRSELEKSRAQLFQAEKMAVVGKLAADVAHSIRNPMTSIKMRLFSLQRGLELNLNQAEDFEVVSEEMRRLDNIVRNFLEFSRPPKLKRQRLDVAEVVEGALELLSRRIEKNGIEVEQHRSDFIPPIEGDPELLKEVMVNLIVNAAEAMPDGGRLKVEIEQDFTEGQAPAVVTRFSDTGPGIPEALREKALEPFFSTKEDGTGLGLPICRRIVEEHGGRLEYRAGGGAPWGSIFIIRLPLGGEGR